MERCVFFIYNLIKSDERYTPGSKGPVYSTLLLISFLELFTLMPIILLANELYQIVSLQKFLSFPRALRYLLIFGVICLIGSVNYYVFARDNGMERLAEKYADRKDEYIRRTWLLYLFVAILVIVVLGALWIIRITLK
jgi:hypothetical protein